ncbi:MAG: lipopolysaccharide heptosyltransferase II [Verrucomicrobiota bacterium]|nr:lipopolysaccharide heptosyltransferase II [Verrucomicrobiota bacterium]
MKYISFAIFSLVYFYCTLLPVGFLLRLGRWMGFLFYYIDGAHRKIAQFNLRVAYGDQWDEKKIRTVARESFMRLGSNFLSYIKLAQIPTDKIISRMEPRGKEILLDAHKKGKGVILVTSHMGNWEIYARVHKFMPTLKFSGIYQKLKNPLIDKVLVDIRTNGGIDMIEKKYAWERGLKKLRNNEVLNFLADQHTGDVGVWIPFFGRLASSTNLAGLFAKKTGSIIIPISCRQKSVGQWIIEAHDPLESEVNGEVLDPNEITFRINQHLEKNISLSPEDYFWVHNRWKTPKPNFLLHHYKRGYFIPPDFPLKPFRILIRVPNWLGDAIMAMPAVSLIKHGRPDTHVTILTRENLSDLWHGFKDADSIITIKKGESSNRIAHKLETEHFDVSITLPNSTSSALPAFFAEIPRRVGYRGKWRKLLLNQTIPESRRHKNDEHQMLDYIGIAREIGADRNLIPLPQLRFEADITRFELPMQKIIIVASGAEYGSAKRWPAAKFAEACRLIALKEKVYFIFVGLESDCERNDKIIKSANVAASNLSGLTTLSELGAILQKATATLSNDSGVMHLSSALGIPTIAIFGSTDPVLTGPIGPKNKIIHHQVECSPCFLRECPIDFRCMNAISPEEVAQAVLGMVSPEVA